MPILRLLRGGSYGPHEIQIMVDAYMEALRLAGVTDRKSLRAETIARRVIFLFERGETDTRQIASLAIEEPGRSKPQISN